MTQEPADPGLIYQSKHNVPFLAELPQTGSRAEGRSGIPALQVAKESLARVLFSSASLCFGKFYSCVLRRSHFFSFKNISILFIYVL